MDEEHTLTIEHGNMKRTIDQAKDTIDLLSQKCKNLNKTRGQGRFQVPTVASVAV
jgi:hypothetical protein